MLFQAKLTAAYAFDARDDRKRIRLDFVDASEGKHTMQLVFVQENLDYFTDHVGNTYTLTERPKQGAWGQYSSIGFYEWPNPHCGMLGNPPAHRVLDMPGLVTKGRAEAEARFRAGATERAAMIQRERDKDLKTLSPEELEAAKATTPFTLYPYQVDAVRDILDPKRNVNAMYGKHGSLDRTIPVSMYVVTSDGADIEATLAQWDRFYFDEAATPEFRGALDGVIIRQDMWFSNALMDVAARVAKRQTPDCEQLWAIREFVKRCADYWATRAYDGKVPYKIRGGFNWAIETLGTYDHKVARRSAWDRLCDLFVGRGA